MSCFGYLHLNIILYSVLCFTVCSAAIHIFGESDLLLEGDAPLTLTCVNDLNSDVDFRFNSKLIGTCYKLFGCNSKDPNFTLSANTSSAPYAYILHTVENFNMMLCGTYRCMDMDNINLHDSVSVSYKGFDNTSFTVDENNASFSITTSCTFHAALQDMTVSWFYFDNPSLQLVDLTTVDDFNRTFECSNYTCDTSRAKTFTFGLHFKDRQEQLQMALIEIKLVNVHFLNKPLIWRSSKMYPVKDIVSENSENQSSTDHLVIPIITVVCVAVFVLIVVIVIVCYRNGMQTNDKIDIRKSKRVEDVSILLTNSGPKSPTNENEERPKGTDSIVNRYGKVSNAYKSSTHERREEFVVALINPKSSRDECVDESRGAQLSTNECENDSNDSKSYTINCKEELSNFQSSPYKGEAESSGIKSFINEGGEESIDSKSPQDDCGVAFINPKSRNECGDQFKSSLSTNECEDDSNDPKSIPIDCKEKLSDSKSSQNESRVKSSDPKSFHNKGGFEINKNRSSSNECRKKYSDSISSTIKSGDESQCAEVSFNDRKDESKDATLAPDDCKDASGKECVHDFSGAHSSTNKSGDDSNNPKLFPKDCEEESNDRKSPTNKRGEESNDPESLNNDCEDEFNESTSSSKEFGEESRDPNSSTNECKEISSDHKSSDNDGKDEFNGSTSSSDKFGKEVSNDPRPFTNDCGEE